MASKVLISSSKALQHLLAPETKTDDVVFRMHYVWTTRVLLAFAGLVLVATSPKDSIVCYTNARALPTAIINLYCWMLNTNLLPAGLRGDTGTEVAHPGVYKFTPGTSLIYQRYYMWVPLMLLFQAATFYAAHALWKEWEGGQVGHLVVGLDRWIPMKSDDGVEIPFAEDEDNNNREEERELAKRYRLVATCLASAWSKRISLFVYYILCQVACLINAVCQIFILDHFFGGQFTTYGGKVMELVSLDAHNRTDPAIQLFPRMTKCSYRQYGFSGNVENYDILCALPNNVYYEKMFIFCYFWYVAVACFSAVALSWWFLAAASETARRWLLDVNGLLRTEGRRTPLVLNVGDWFFLYLLLGNIDDYHHKKIVENLVEQLEVTRRDTSQSRYGNKMYNRK